MRQLKSEGVKRQIEIMEMSKFKHLWDIDLIRHSTKSRPAGFMMVHLVAREHVEYAGKEWLAEVFRHDQSYVQLTEL